MAHVLNDLINLRLSHQRVRLLQLAATGPSSEEIVLPVSIHSFCLSLVVVHSTRILNDLEQDGSHGPLLRTGRSEKHVPWPVGHGQCGYGRLRER